MDKDTAFLTAIQLSVTYNFAEPDDIRVVMHSLITHGYDKTVKLLELGRQLFC